MTSGPGGPAARGARTHSILLGVFLAVLGWSAIRPHDYPTWAMEVAPAVVGVAVLGAVYRRFRLTTFGYVLVLVHSAILMYGGKHTYALNPLFDWIKEAWGLSRNYYDRLGHFAQGFFPAIYAREVLIRTSPVRRGGWLAFTVISFCLAVSAMYEFIEWWAALLLGEGAESFLGTQGDVWDTQWDMFLCLVGAVTALLTLSRAHDRALRRERLAA